MVPFKSGALQEWCPSRVVSFWSDVILECESFPLVSCGLEWFWVDTVLESFLFGIVLFGIVPFEIVPFGIVPFGMVPWCPFGCWNVGGC